MKNGMTPKFSGFGTHFAVLPSYYLSQQQYRIFSKLILSAFSSDIS
jgi:hypothetical protein